MLGEVLSYNYAKLLTMDLIVGSQTSTGNTSWATDNRYFTPFSVDAANSTQLFQQLE